MNQIIANANSPRGFYHDQDAFHNYSNNSYDHLANPRDFENFIRAATLGDLKGVCNYLQKPYCRVDEESNLDENHIGWTALMYASHYGHYNIVKALLEKRADANHRDANGSTPLMCSAQNGHTRCIEMLVSQGKADIKLKDHNNYTAAYYATHYGHGNNKIIAKLLRIPNQSNGYGFNNSAQSNHRQQHSNRDHHYAGSNVSSPSSNFSDRSYSFPAVQQSNAAQKSPTTLNFAHTNSSFSEDTLAQYSFGSSNHNNSFGEQRRGFGELAAHQARAQMNSSMANTTLDVNELLGRNNQRPRAIFKQRQRRLSPSTSQQQFMLDMQHSNAASLMNQSFAAHSSATREHSKQSRCHSFSASNQMLLSPLALQSTPANTQRSGSLTLDLGVNFNNQQSPTGSTGTSNCSPDQGYSSWPKQNIFRYDELSPPFQSPTSPCENRSFDDQHQSTKQDLSILNMNVSWQDSNDETPNDQPRNKPRNSTFVQTADQSSYNLANSHSTSSSSQLASLESAWNQPCATSLDQKFGELADDLNDFLGQQSKHLGQRDLQELSELFAEKHIGLYRFLTMSEDDLKAIGISQHQHLATLIAAQVDFLRQIGIESGSETSNETMRYVIFLGSRLERAKKELVKLQNELKMYRMGGLHDIDMKGSRMQSSYPGF